MYNVHRTLHVHFFFKYSNSDSEIQKKNTCAILIFQYRLLPSNPPQFRTVINQKAKRSSAFLLDIHVCTCIFGSVTYARQLVG